MTDPVENRMMVSTDGRPLLTLEVVQARALGMALAAATYVGLEPSGPWLTVIRD